MALQFKQMLLKVDHALSTEDVQALVFLCADLLGKDVSRIATAQDLFKQLEELDCLTEDCQSLLAELLIVAKRNDLVRQLSLCQNSQCLVSPYRKMLFSLAENITTEDLKSIKFLLSQHLPRRKLEDNITTLGLFLELERMDKLSQTKLETLEQIVTSVCPSLRRKITQFKEKNGPGVQSTGSSYMSVRPAQQEQSPSYQVIHSRRMQMKRCSVRQVVEMTSPSDHASLHEQLSASLSLATDNDHFLSPPPHQTAAEARTENAAGMSLGLWP
ncbi:hypothetical protein JZ751_009216 [Albula glossodonta]|uniref:DED domain-containing protein n=1 Tax=Albula glossodonta TaxID=121402 RepID=A0A8T2N1S5_9TELE|nr:hypothetical protein JZ751_009216 [Albula glossodonta]